MRRGHGQAGPLRARAGAAGLGGYGLALQNPRILLLPEGAHWDRLPCAGGGGTGCKLTSLRKATQAETLSTGSSTTTQHRLCSCSTLFSHTDTGIFSPPRLTTSTCGQGQARAGTRPAPGTRALPGAAHLPDVLEFKQSADQVSDTEPYNLSECSKRFYQQQYLRFLKDTDMTHADSSFPSQQSGPRTGLSQMYSVGSI